MNMCANKKSNNLIPQYGTNKQRTLSVKIPESGNSVLRQIPESGNSNATQFPKVGIQIFQIPESGNSAYISCNYFNNL